MRMDCLGPRKSAVPSMGERKYTPSSVIVILAEAQAEYLKSARIRHERLLPAHEFVEAARALHIFRSRSGIQVVGVADKDLGARFGDLVALQSAHRRARRDGDECGCLNFAVRGRDEAEPCAGFFGAFEYFEFEHPGQNTSKRAVCDSMPKCSSTR